MRSFLKKLKLFLSFLLRKELKFNVGSAGINNDKSWYATDIETLNLTKETDWKRLLLFLRLNNIMAEHVWEHLSDQDIKLANANCFKFLKKGGKLRLAVPDGYFPDKDYIEYVRPGGSGYGADDHKILFNYQNMRKFLEEAGFNVNLLEYWDESGTFHFHEWDVKDGYIMRSKRFDSRNQGEELKYTSLIVDAIK